LSLPALPDDDEAVRWVAALNQAAGSYALERQSINPVVRVSLRSGERYFLRASKAGPVGGWVTLDIALSDSEGEFVKVTRAFHGGGKSYEFPWRLTKAVVIVRLADVAAVELLYDVPEAPPTPPWWKRLGSRPQP
jgi:hypothetical protein